VAAAVGIVLLAVLFFGVRAVLASLSEKPAGSQAPSVIIGRKLPPKTTATPTTPSVKTTAPPAPSANTTAPPVHSAVPVANPATDQAVPVLMYHHIMPVPTNNIAITPTMFDAQMRYLRDRGWHPVTMAQFEAFVLTGKRLPNKPVLISFDDGRMNQLTYGVPILKKYGFTATFFVVKKWIDGPSNSFMHVPQLKQLIADGFDVESHTSNHMMLYRFQSRSTKQYEAWPHMRYRMWYPTYGMRMWMDSVLGGPAVTALAYPGGGFDSYSERLAKESGYLTAYTTNTGYVTYNGQSAYALPRWNAGARGLRLSTFEGILTRAERYKPKAGGK
jgi:peptidoglycan/xylan/chitin deacetylase (PgdA/CDA1 family)